ncbi:condensin complex subunit 1 [Dendroctonus ponderosae]|uniref:condensin complex subunit 1 n=1 Tax=Dendroctonus ponderosae TaxID=77166 RepID=UPI0020353644|nr:condensin complex subunit 1 [Dendroctonus ponderosae]
MADFNFSIPSKLRDLLIENGDYFVRNVIVPGNIQAQLKESKLAFQQDGPEWILENFDIYFSILYQDKSVSLETVYKSYLILHAAVKKLSNCLGFLLEDKSSITEEVQQKYRNVLKMLIYIYIETILFVEQANVTSAKNQGLLKGRKRPNSEDTAVFNLDKNSILVSLNNILQLEIALFWEPPVVEEHFINLLAEVCYKFLENPQIKFEKSLKDELFNLMGCLMKSYNHSTTFAIRMAQMIKDHEHLIQCLAEGTKYLVETHNCKGLIHALIQEVTEWQTDEKFQDSQGSKFCGQFITSLAVSMPSNMLPELLYLNKFLGHESAALRNSVLNVMTEVILHVQAKLELNKEEREYLNELLSILMEHMRDKSAHVRTRVMQHFARLQTEGAIPPHLVNDVLENVVKYHLHDKAALVRKSSVGCVTTFLSYNVYGSQLSLSEVTKELERKRELLDQLQPQVDQVKSLKAKELEAEWHKMVPELREFLLELLQNEDEAEENCPETGEEEATELIRMYIGDGKYKEALQIWKRSINTDDNMGENPDSDKILDEFLSHLQEIYQGFEILSSVKNGAIRDNTIITEEDFQKFLSLRETCDYLTRAVNFLKLINIAVELIVELLETTCISDMQEAVAFFNAAYLFKIDNAQVGVTAMMKMMQCNEENRKDLIIEAFKNMYLKTDASNMKDHSMTVINRLIGLLLSASAYDMDNLELIISEWVHKGILDNNIIDMLWQYFTKKVDVSDQYSLASVELLRMAALKRGTVISRNIKLVASVAFAERGRKNLAFLGSACNFLAVAGRDRIDITSADPPFSISCEDSIFSDLFNILTDTFFTPQEFYYHALAGALEFVYKVCGKPHKLCEQFTKQIVETLKTRISDEGIEEFIYIRVCQLVGLVALKHLNYLDETVYKELKRRANYQMSKKNGKPTEPKMNKSQKSASASKKSGNNTTTATSAGDESRMEGAQAEDQDAEFILHILEKNTVTGLGLLSQLVHPVVKVCANVDVYDNSLLQGAAVVALIRCMLVSSEFCLQNIQLLFTIFEKSTHLDIKKSILLHIPDLLTRFPNIIEPWMHRIFDGLKNSAIEIRTATFYSLSCLILRDMIRAHSHIHLMVNGLIDPDKELSSMCRTFFTTLSQKENNLYNILPDIFSHLMESDSISEENSKYIMKFLFELMEKCKHMGNLVDRFCVKFKETDNINHQRHIAYCLSLIVYNDKTLRKLLNNFPMYKHLVHDSDIYSNFKTILQGCSKQGKAELKPIIEELEKAIASVFDVNPDAQVTSPSAAHKQQKRRTTKTKGRKRS